MIGTAIGIFLGRHREANRFFDGWLIFFLNVPALITIVLSYLWIGLNEAAAITAVALNKIPNVAVTLREGASRRPALRRDGAGLPLRSTEDPAACRSAAARAWLQRRAPAWR